MPSHDHFFSTPGLLNMMFSMFQLPKLVLTALLPL